MAIEFKKVVEHSMFSAKTNLKEEVLPIEFRTDPLTGDMGIVLEYRWRRLKKPDLSQLIAKSLERECPFCPEAIDKITPQFPAEFLPEGRIKVGEAVVFPNARPYMSHSAVTVLSRQHFVDLPQFTEDMLANGFLASQIYLREVQKYDPEAKYCLVNCNYMPYAGSSQIHPHFQVLAGHFPLKYHKELLEASQRYYIKNGINYWLDFIAKERELNERYIGTVGDTVWFTSFVPRSWQFDVLAIFQGKESFTALSQRDIEDFCRGLRKVFGYMSDQNFCSFNLCLYSGILGEDYFWTQARLIQRGAYPPLGVSDCSSVRLLFDTMVVLRRPELVCQELKAYFG